MTTEKDSKLYKQLTKNNSGVLESRAKRFVTRAHNAQKRIVDSLQDELLSLEERMETLIDVSPDSSTSLKLKEVDADNWAKQGQELRVELQLKRAELKIAKETLTEWFE